MKDPYKILGATQDDPFEELKAKYESLKTRYGEDRFLPGEAGNDAARNLSDLEDAWKIIIDNHERSRQKEQFGGNFGAIDNMIKEGRYDEAQSALDSISDRAAEWHYLQSIVFYKREWMSECKAQLQMAVNMEPWNDKYKNAFEKLNLIMGNPKTDPRTIGVDPNAPPPPANGQMCGNSCANCCLAYCIADCCCTMTQCC